MEGIGEIYKTLFDDRIKTRLANFKSRLLFKKTMGGYYSQLGEIYGDIAKENTVQKYNTIQMKMEDAGGLGLGLGNDFGLGGGLRLGSGRGFGMTLGNRRGYAKRRSNYRRKRPCCRR
jgi:hypothetical protein